MITGLWQCPFNARRLLNCMLFKEKGWRKHLYGPVKKVVMTVEMSYRNTHVRKGWELLKQQSSLRRKGILNASYDTAKTAATLKSLNSCLMSLLMPFKQIIRLQNCPSCLIWHLQKINYSSCNIISWSSFALWKIVQWLLTQVQTCGTFNGGCRSTQIPLNRFSSFSPPSASP